MRPWFPKLLSAEDPLAALDARLRAAAPRAQAPAALHRSIMRAVQVAQRPSPASPRLAFLRWAVVPVGAALALFVAWQSLRHTGTPAARDTQSLAAAASALEVGGQMARAVPAAVVAPLSDELQGLSQDLDNAAQHLLASVP